jgi:hypothetical protein
MSTQVTVKRVPSAKSPAKRAATAVATASKKSQAPLAKKLPASKVISPPAAASTAKHAAVVVELKEPVKVKTKLVRDSFTMPKVEYASIDLLKHRAVSLAQPIKKSELLRAGVKALSAMSDKAFLSALKAVPTIKTGRPGKA